jgi:hypothetical protein
VASISVRMPTQRSAGREQELAAALVSARAEILRSLGAAHL